MLPYVALHGIDQRHCTRSRLDDRIAEAVESMSRHFLQGELPQTAGTRPPPCLHGRSDAHSGSGGPSGVKPFLRSLIDSGPGRRFRTWLAEADVNGDAAETAPAKLCFIHIPKTGGTYVSQQENFGRSVVFPLRNLGHATVVDPDWQLFLDIPAPFGEEQAIPKACLDGSVVFSNVRNLFSFFVSYLHHAAGSLERYRNPHHYDFAAANKGFDYLLKTIAHRDAIWPSRKFVHYQLFAQPSGAAVLAHRPDPQPAA